MFAEELSRRFDAHAAADRRGSSCLLVGLAVLGVLLLQQAVAVSGDDEASAAFYGALLRGVLCLVPIYALARLVATARLRAAAEEAAGARAVALAARLAADPAAASVPLGHPLLAFALPHSVQRLPRGVGDTSHLYRPHVAAVMREVDAENDAQARRTEAAVIAYLDAAAAQAQARAEARRPGAQQPPPPSAADEFV